MAGDEQIRAQIMRPYITRPRQALELTEDESWQLLASVSLGRIVFTLNARPTVRPVNHLAADKTIIIRSHLGAAIVKHTADDGAVVCYEADELDPVRHTGWSVIATGRAWLIREPAAVARYQRLLEPWIDSRMDYVIAIKPEILTGIQLVGWCR